MSNDGKDKAKNVAKRPEPKPTRRKRSWTRWILPVLALLVIIGIGFVLWGKMHEDIWAYYTDDEGLQVAVEEKKERLVLWEDPHQTLFAEKKPDTDEPEAADPINQDASQRVEATFSADGSMMVLTRWSQDFEKTDPEETGADLYLSTWDGRVWSRPQAMVELNTGSNERGAAFSRDGRYLYFCSNREGGAGGYDIYVARFDGTKWTGVERLSDSVNSPKNETGPAPSTDDTKLYFSSDRNKDGEVHDIYVASRFVAEPEKKEPGADGADEPELKKEEPKKEEAEPALPTVPIFAKAESVLNLNSEADDIEAALTGRGDYVFLASDRDRDEKSGFNLYLSRVVNGRVRPPEKVDVYIDHGNATDPAVRMEGFDLLFSSDAELAAGPAKPDDQVADAAGDPGYRLYRSTTREVIGYTDLSRWDLFKELLDQTKWWILLAIASLLVLIYLLEKWQDLTSLFHKALAVSVMLHALFFMWAAYRELISNLDMGGEQQSPEVALSIDALAQEELAMESEQELAQVAESTQLTLTKNVQEFREVEFNPKNVMSNSVPVLRKASDQSLVSDFTPSKANESAQVEEVTKPKEDVPLFTELAAVELPDLEVNQLEVAQAPAAQNVEPVDSTKDDFQLNEEAIQKVETDQVQVALVVTPKVEVQSDTKSVASSSKPEQTTDSVKAVDGLEAENAPTADEGTATQALANNLPGDNPVDALTSGLELEVAAVDTSKDDFRGDARAIQQVKTGKGQTGQAQNENVNVQSGAKSVPAGGQPAPTTDTGGDTINPSDGFEADVSPPSLEGSATKVALAANLPGLDPVDALAAGVKLETPENSLDPKALTKFIKKLRGKPSLSVIEQLGGSGETERAIGMGLDWFTNNQEPDGHWDMGKHGSKSQYNTAGTGLALLCYYGWGIKHGDNSRHANALRKALDWLLKQQKENGDLRGPNGQHGMYAHGIAAIALCEGYGITKDPKLKEPAEKAIDFILKAQHSAGGWRYQPGQAGDLSVTGWQYMALHSARMADLEVPDEAFEKTRSFMDSVSGGFQGGLYGYTGPSKSHPAMTATGMFLRQLDLVPPTDPRQQEGAAFMGTRMVKANRVDFYFDYYATLALYQHQGPIWREWNENLKEAYVTLQKTDGAERGSWDPKGQHVNSGGRVLSTGLAILSLEVYYRLLPLYGFGREGVEFEPATGAAPVGSRLKKINSR